MTDLLCSFARYVSVISPAQQWRLAMRQMNGWVSRQALRNLSPQTSWWPLEGLSTLKLTYHLCRWALSLSLVLWPLSSLLGAYPPAFMESSNCLGSKVTALVFTTSRKYTNVLFSFVNVWQHKDLQVRGTMNWSCPEWMDWFHGGLQYQIEHHLFPRMPRHNLREASKLVQPACKRLGLPYHSPTFFEVGGISSAATKTISSYGECPNLWSRQKGSLNRKEALQSVRIAEFQIVSDMRKLVRESLRVDLKPGKGNWWKSIGIQTPCFSLQAVLETLQTLRGVALKAQTVDARSRTEVQNSMQVLSRAFIW